MDTHNQKITTIIFFSCLILLVISLASATTMLLLDNQSADDIRLTDANGDSNASSVAVDSFGGTHIVWQDNREGNYEIYYNKIIQDTFKIHPNDLRITYNGGASQNPDIGIDSLGNIHIVWQDYRNNNWEIYYKKLSNTGANVTGDERVTYDPAYSICPTITIDSDNTIHITWYDNRSGNYEIYWNKRVEPDLTTPQLILSSTHPLEAALVEVTTTIENIGNNQASSINVTCFIDNTPIGTQTINLAAHSNMTLYFSWNALYGTHYLLIAVDPQNTIAESYENNNNISAYITVSKITEFTNLSIPASATVTHSVDLQVTMETVNDPQQGGTPNDIDMFVNYSTSSYFDNATIRLHYQDNQHSNINESSLQMYYWNMYEYQGPQWTLISDSGVNTAQNYIWANVTDFGLFAPLGTIEQNQPPHANFTYTPANPTIMTIISFTDTSTDTDGYIISWLWDFGDQTTSTDQHPTHQYTIAQTYHVTLTVTDNTSLTNATTKNVVVNSVPDLVITQLTVTRLAGPITISATIQNKGTVDITTPFQTTLYGAFFWSNTPYKYPICIQETPVLNAGATTIITHTITTPPNYYYYAAYTDSTHCITELNENNNRRYIVYTKLKLFDMESTLE